MRSPDDSLDLERLSIWADMFSIVVSQRGTGPAAVRVMAMMNPISNPAHSYIGPIPLVLIDEGSSESFPLHLTNPCRQVLVLVMVLLMRKRHARVNGLRYREIWEIWSKGWGWRM